MATKLIVDTDRKKWVWATILAGVSYFVVGFVFAVLANPSVSERMRVTWRLSAWVASAAVFAAHIGHEHFRRRGSPGVTAWHAGLAVAIGAFLLAVGATVHQAMAASHASGWRFPLALVVWPVVTALPAFLVALVACALLARLPTKRLAS